jgi:predicted membrane protein
VSGTADLNFLEGAFSDLRVVLNCVSGEHIIRCPRDIGVGLHFKSLTGQIKAPALRRIKGIFVNDLYGEAETTLEIAVSSVSGRVFVQLGNT